MDLSSSSAAATPRSAVERVSNGQRNPEFEGVHDGLLSWSPTARGCATHRAAVVVVHGSRARRRSVSRLVHDARVDYGSRMDMAAGRSPAVAVDDRRLRLRIARRPHYARMGPHRDRLAAGPEHPWRKRVRVPATPSELEDRTLRDTAARVIGSAAVCNELLDERDLARVVGDVLREPGGHPPESDRLARAI